MSGSKHKRSSTIASWYCYQALYSTVLLYYSCYTVLLSFSRYCTIRLKVVYFWFVMYFI